MRAFNTRIRRRAPLTAVLVWLLLAITAQTQTWVAHSTVAAGQLPVHKVFPADINGDHISDLLFINDEGLWMLKNDGVGNLSAPESLRSGVLDATEGHFNGTAPEDIVFLAWKGDTQIIGLFLMKNLGKGAFAPPSEIVDPGLPLFDQTCRIASGVARSKRGPAIYITCGSVKGIVYIGVADLHSGLVFSTATLPSSEFVEELAVGDFDRDDRDDLSVKVRRNDGSVETAVLWGSENGFVKRAVSISDGPSSLAASDVDGDTASDLIYLRNQRLTILRSFSKSRSASDREDIAIANECTAESVGAVDLQRTTTNRGVRAKDLIVGEKCEESDGRSTWKIGIFSNQNATDLEILPSITNTANGAVFTLSVSVKATHKSVVVSGSVLLGVDDSPSRSIILVDGKALFKTILKPGLHRIMAVFGGDASLNPSAGVVSIVVSGIPSDTSLTDQNLFYPEDGKGGKLSDAVYYPSRRPRTMHAALIPHLLKQLNLDAYNSSLTPGTSAPYGTAFTFTADSGYGKLITGPPDPGFSCGTNFGSTCYGGSDTPNGYIHWLVDGVDQGGNYSPPQYGPNYVCGYDDVGQPMYCNNIYLESVFSSVLPGGTHTVTATIPSSQDAYAAFTTTWTVTVSKTTPSLSIACSPNPITYGPQTSSCTAHVSGGSGTISFTIDGNPWFTGNVDGGGNVTGGGFNWSGAGNHTIGVTSSGDSSYNGTSSSTFLTINKATPTVTVSCSPNPITYGPQTTTCTAHTSGGGGPVTLYWNGLGNGWGSGNFDASGNFSLTGFNTQPPGNYNVIAVSSGDANYNGATGSTTVTINKATPTISVSCSPNPATYQPAGGGNVSTCTASVSGGATGTVMFTNGTGGSWTQSLSAGVATLSGFQSFAAQAWVMTGTYNGDAHNNSVNASTTLTIHKATPTLSVSCSPNPMTYGSTSTCIAHVSGGGGTVSFTYDGLAWTTIGVDGSGNASTGPAFQTNPVGIHTIGVASSGDTNYNGASNTTTITINSAVYPTVTQLSTSNNPTTYGAGTTFTALVNTGGHAPTGTAAFTSNGVSIGSGMVSTVTTTNLAPYSQAVGGSGWFGYCGTTSNVTLNTPDIAAPDGTMTATKFVTPSSMVCGSGGVWGAVDNLPGGLTAGQPYSYTVWLRGASGGEIVDASPNDCTINNFTLTTSWKRYSYTIPSMSSASASCGTGTRGIQILSRNPNTTYYVWGAQVEQSAIVGPYVATTSAPASGSGGVATLTTGSLPVGTDSIVATYGGDGMDLSSLSAPLAEVVNKATPTITVASSSNPANVGDSVTFTATVPPGATGTVTFKDGGTIIGSGTISGNTATVTTATLAVGTHSISAVYSGDGNFNSASSSALTQFIKQTPSITWPAPAAITYGTALSGAQLNATSGGVAGTFVYTPGAGTILNAGSQTLSVTFTPTDTVTYNTVTATVSLTVIKQTPSITWPAPAAITYGTALSGAQLNATSGGVAGTFVYTPGAGTILNAGSQTLSVTFTPSDSTNYNSKTTTVVLTVDKAGSFTTVISSSNPATFGSAVVFTASIAPGGTGTVTFKDGGTTIGTGTISGGHATFLTSALSTGGHSITAQYSGDSNYLASVSSTLVQTINKASPLFTFTSSLNPSLYGDSVVLTVQLTGISGVMPTGIVAITDSGVPLGIVTLDASGRASYTTTNLTVASHPLKAVYGGDLNYQ